MMAARIEATATHCVGWSPTSLYLVSLRADFNICSFRCALPLELTGSFSPLLPPPTEAGISDLSGQPLAQLSIPGPGGNQPSETMQPLRWSWGSASHSHLGWTRVHWKAGLVTREKVLWKSMFLHSRVKASPVVLSVSYTVFLSWGLGRCRRKSERRCRAAAWGDDKDQQCVQSWSPGLMGTQGLSVCLTGPPHMKMKSLPILKIIILLRRKLTACPWETGDMVYYNHIHSFISPWPAYI